MNNAAGFVRHSNGQWNAATARETRMERNEGHEGEEEDEARSGPFFTNIQLRVADIFHLAVHENE